MGVSSVQGGDSLRARGSTKLWTSASSPGADASNTFSITRIFIISYAISYFLLPLAAYVDEAWAGTPTLFERSQVPGGVLLAAVGLLAFLHGYKFNCWNAFTMQFSTPRPEYLSRITARRDRLWIMWIITASGLLAILVYFYLQYSDALFSYQGAELWRGQGVTVNVYITLSTFSSVLALLLFKLCRSKVIIPIQAVLLLVAGGGSRGQLGCFLVAFAVTSGHGVVLSSRAAFKTLFRYVALGLVLVLLGLALVFVRSSASTNAYNVRRAVLATFGEGQMFALVRSYYADHLLYGQTIADIRYVFLPRQIFPDKPWTYGKARFEEALGLDRLYGENNHSSSTFGMLSELYANFGVFGIILGMVCWGWFYAFLERLRKTPAESLGFFVYLNLCMFQFWPFRHGLLGLVQVLTVPTLFAPIILQITYMKQTAETARLQAARSSPGRVRSALAG